MPRRKNWKDGLQQAIIETGQEETAIAVQVEGATFEIPGGLNVQLDHDGASPDSIQVGDGTTILDINPDGSINVTPTQVSSAVTSRVTASISTVTLVTANSSRRELILYNDSNRDCYIKFGASATSTDFSVLIPPKGHYFMNIVIYTGIVTAIWKASPTGAMQITEL